jgi:NAD(P)-dependent dehydrogenase (short-subunit alcohol dehydrogenase family)
LIGRNSQKLESLKKELQVFNKNIDLFTCDLSSVTETIATGKKIQEKYATLDVLLNNAGAFFAKYELTKEELESTFALNHLNYFILSLLLLPSLKKSEHGRIVNVASRAHMGVSLDFNNLQGELKYEGWKQYQKSKLMNIYFTYELSKRLSSTNVTVNCLHPGFVKTKFGHNNEGLAKTLVRIGQNLLAISESDGAKTSIFLSMDNSVSNVTGKYFVKNKIQKSSDISYDNKAQKELWAYTETILKNKFGFEVGV